MATDNLEFGLKKLGLEDNEAKVYLAALELGPSPVQKIAQRAGVPRATTYLVLDDLKTKGLISSFEQGKKTFFAAEKPDQLERLVAKRANEVRTQEELAKGLIEELTNRGQFKESQARPKVRFYEGAEALKTLLRDNFRDAKGEILNILSYDDAEKLLNRMNITWSDLSERRKRARVRRRVIYTWKETKPSPDRVARDAIYIPYDDFSCKADIGIIGNRVAFVPYDEPIRAVAIEDKTIADAMRSLFNALWQEAQSAKKRQRT